ncbi:unnamed protein product, partial [Amoebophrya sp. A120]|eukprot:GSA120T00017352001.1
MMTSSILQQQLLRLREAHPTTSRSLKAGKSKAAFTFRQKDFTSAQERAEYFSEIKEHSLEIFHEVQALDPEFAQFESLFHLNQKQRQFLTPEEIKNRDGLVEKFLLLLSPFLASSEVAVVLLDLVVDTFECCSFHLDALLQCLLPYHD